MLTRKQLDTLRDFNVRRCALIHTEVGPEWDAGWWRAATLFEIGEAGNELKKLFRAHSWPAPTTTHVLDFGAYLGELADVLIYCDLWLHSIRVPMQSPQEGPHRRGTPLTRAEMEYTRDVLTYLPCESASMIVRRVSELIYLAGARPWYVICHKFNSTTRKLNLNFDLLDPRLQ